MKKVLIYLTCIVAILIFADNILGMCSKYYIKNYQLTGRYRSLDRLLKEVNTDIILIGNSAILNSINPEIVENSLSMTCYNGGIVGQSIDFSETIIDCVLQRHTPQIFVLGLRPEEMGGNIGEGIYDVLKPYYKMGFKSIDDHFNQTSGLERFLLQSNLIRYNTIWVRVLLYMLYDNTKSLENGFMPKDIPSSLPKLKKIEKCEMPVEHKLKSIERIIQKCRNHNIKLIICFPPTLLTFENDMIPCVKAVNDLCTFHHIPCFIDYKNEDFQCRSDLFYDEEHLNKKGAVIYSKLMSNRFNTFVSNNNK